MSYPVLGPKQKAHLEANLDLFEGLSGTRDVDEYFADYGSEKPDLYERVCSDLGLEPVGREVEVTQRGFGVYAELVDRYGSKVRVQHSSLATETCVWIFASDNPDPNYENPSPHLTVEQAKAIRDGLDGFIRDAESGLL